MISIVIPIYNEEQGLSLLYDRLTEAAVQWEEKFEVVLVDDGSSDSSNSIMRGFVENDDRFHLVELSRNFGHQGAISAGLEYARGDAVVVMDGDLQDPPEELPIFLDKWREGYQVVYAIRTERKEGLPKRMAYSAFYRFLAFISDIDIPLDSGDFALIDRSVVDVLKKELPENIRFVRGLRAYAGFRQIGIPYKRDERAAGEAKYTFRKLLILAMDGVFGFSTLPLRMATYVGLFISLLSFAVGLFFIVHRIFNFKVLGYSPEDTPGLASLAAGIYFLGGVILTFLGILGEYIGRVYIEVKRRPPYIVAATYGAVADGTARAPETGREERPATNKEDEQG
ncbi:MAG: glycosyltransferase [Acidobacteria bacterium]|mgnify:CR=1 FL=1|nr:MAG: glycosyltransferase [Acidobacteriota bacterium]REJ98226.1 MAG: glycosyltransferase [Acidobacteriota bacterium]REK16970.1 MAG: glycosyltransferase [Acidobacteriota bacterium]REK42880.1 MAG: glycosyltransferase [Acidobacteriota bacterium]